MKTNSIHRVAIEEFTTPCPIVVSSDTDLGEVKRLMDDNRVRHIPVVRNNIPVGMISDRDLKLLAQNPFWQEIKVGKVMLLEPYSVTYDTKIETAALEMSAKKIGSAIVIDEIGEIMGIFTSTDALNALVEIARGEV